MSNTSLNYKRVTIFKKLNKTEFFELFINRSFLRVFQKVIIQQHSKSKTMYFMNILKEQVQNVQIRH